MDNIRRIAAEETVRLRPLLEELAMYHNSVSLHHAGAYPAHSIEDQLRAAAEDVRSGKAEIYAAECGGEIIGFGMIFAECGEGVIKYLVIAEAQRGRGIGRRLMGTVLARFSALGVRHIEVKVIAGNPALRFYETCGFELNAHLLWRREK